MTPTTYGRIERGFPTTTSKLQDIADCFGVPIEHVLLLPTADREQAYIEALLASRRLKQQQHALDAQAAVPEERRVDRPMTPLSPELIELVMRLAHKIAEETHARQTAAAARRKRQATTVRRKKNVSGEKK